MSPGWLSQEKSDRLIDYLEERVFCPNFQTEYTCYLENPPVWQRRTKQIQQYSISVYVGTYRFFDGLVVEHQVYDIPPQLQEHKNTPKQQHYICLLQPPSHTVVIGHFYIERNRGAWPHDACYAAWATQAPET